MEIKRFGKKCIDGIVVFLASLSFGQFSIAVIDTILWIVQQTAKYSVQENSSAKNRRAQADYMKQPPMPWLVFLVVFIDLHIFRVLFSMILVKFNRKPINLIDILRVLRKWRRELHSIRLRGLIRIRKQQLRNKQKKGAKLYESESDTSEIHPHKKRRTCDELVDHNLLEQLLNRTYTNTDLDSTYELEKSEDESIDAGSNHELEWDTIQSQHSAEDTNTDVTCESAILYFSAEKPNPSVEFSESSNSKNIVNEKEALNQNIDPISTGTTNKESNPSDESSESSNSKNIANEKEALNQNNDPISSGTTESEYDTNVHSKLSTEDDALPIKPMSESNDFVPNTDVTCESAISDSSAEKSNPSFEPIEGTDTVQSTSESNNSKHTAIGKASLNQYTDPTDALIAKLVALNKAGKCQVHINHQHPMKTMSREFLKTEDTVKLGDNGRKCFVFLKQ